MLFSGLADSIPKGKNKKKGRDLQDFIKQKRTYINKIIEEC